MKELVKNEIIEKKKEIKIFENTWGLCNKQNERHGRNRGSLSIGKRLVLFSPEVSNIKINIRNVETVNIQNR